MAKFLLMIWIMMGSVWSISVKTPTPSADQSFHPHPIKRTLSIYNGNVSQTMLISVANTLIETQYAYQWGFDKLLHTNSVRTSPMLKVGLFALDALVFLVDIPVFYGSLYDFGKRRTLISWKGDSTYRLPNREEGIDNIYALPFYRLFNPFKRDERGRLSHVHNTTDPKALHEYDAVLFNGGGYNMMTYYAGKIENKIQSGGGHILDFPHYIYTKMNLITHPFMMDSPQSHHEQTVKNDLDHVIAGYRAVGVDVRSDELKFFQLSTLLSGTTFSFLNGWKNFLKTEDPSVPSLTIYGVRWPDLRLFFNPRGYSYEISSHIDMNDQLRISGAFEWILKGEYGYQFTPGITYKLHGKAGDLAVGLNLLFSEKLGHVMNINYAPYSQFDHPMMKNFFLNWTWYEINSDTLLGQNLLPTFPADGSVSIFLWGMGFRY